MEILRNEFIPTTFYEFVHYRLEYLSARQNNALKLLNRERNFASDVENLLLFKRLPRGRGGNSAAAAEKGENQ